MIFEYPGLHGATSHCELEIHRGRHRVIVEATERDDNPGLSVTNAAESVATLACRSYGIEPDTLVWIEKYPYSSTFPPSIDRVEFKVVGDEFYSPRWTTLTNDEYDDILRNLDSNLVWLNKHTKFGPKFEREADEYAYHLAVSEEEIGSEGLKTAPEIAAYFGVPVEMVEVQGRLV